jgi:hypothetical protein
MPADYVCDVYHKSIDCAAAAAAELVFSLSRARDRDVIM